MVDEDDDTPTRPAALPSAQALHELTSLAKQQPGKKRSEAAWRLVTSVVGNPDAHAVIDYARENELVLPCEQTDGAAANLTWTSPIDGSEMVWIPPGKFVYGTGGETADAAGFSLGRWPVTNEQFAKFVADTKYAPASGLEEGFLTNWTGGKPPKGKERHPVTWVSLIDALAYCRWAGATLPTEWLWEKAARGPDGRPFPWGDAPPTKHLAHIATNGTCAVGMYSHVRSPYGCEDLVGNVSEWCLPDGGEPPGSFPPPYPEMALPTEDELSFGVVRGACFLRTSTASAKAHHTRHLSVTRRNQWTGFRLAVFLPVRPAK